MRYPSAPRPWRRPQACAGRARGLSFLSPQWTLSGAALLALVGAMAYLTAPCAPVAESATTSPALPSSLLPGQAGGAAGLTDDTVATDTVAAAPASSSRITTGSLIGVNYFDAFARLLKDPDDHSYREGFRALRQDYHIPFVRFMACGYWPVDWRLYQEDRDEHFRRLDAVVAAAEELDLGLIPSLFWNYSALPDLCGEPVSAWGEPDSATRALMAQYAGETIARYRHSSAIWAWEFGNEFLLSADLPGDQTGLPPVAPSLGTPAERTVRDKLTRGQVLSAYAHFAQLARRLDPHRPILTGDALPRPSAAHNTRDNTWDMDGPEEWDAQLAADNPPAFNAVSIHVYPHNHEGTYFEPAVSLEALVDRCAQVARASGRPLYMGEFGWSRTEGEEAERQWMERMLRLIEKHRIPWSAFWVYDYSPQDDSFNIAPGGDRVWILEALGRFNRSQLEDQ